MSRGGGWGNAWPTEVAEGWLPGPVSYLRATAMQSQSNVEQNLGLVQSRRANCHAAAARCLEPSLGSSMVNVRRDQWRSRRQRKQQHPIGMMMAAQVGIDR